MSSKASDCKMTGQHADIMKAMGAEARTEHRRARRFEQHTRAQITPSADGRLSDPIAIQLTDLSHRGLSFHTAAQMARGQQFVFNLPGNDSRTTPVLCTVAHCRRASDTKFRVGAEFTCVVREQAKRVEAASDADLERIRQSILA